MDIADVEQLVHMVRESGVGELTLRQDGARISIRKAARIADPTVSAEMESVEYTYSAQYAEVVDDGLDGLAEEAGENILVTAPLVGVFAHVKPLAGLNARVSEGQVVGVIESMKLTTEIKSPVTGTIVDIFIEASHPVEYGQALFEIRPD